MKKFMMLGALVAVMVAALAIPALAKDGFHFGSVNQERLERWQDRAEKKGLSFDEYLLYRFGGFEDYKDRWDHNDWWKDHDDERRDDRDDRRDDRDNDVNEAVPAVEQSFEQEAESGDVNQPFNVSNKGDNSNQCAGIQGVANTGNAQNQISVVQNGSTADDFSFEDSGASITMNPNSFTSCDQEVNQAATASGW